jgi:hypothetical protein
VARPIRRRAVRGQTGSHPGRFYQDIAVERVLEAIANNRRRILFTLATGTGFTGSNVRSKGMGSPLVHGSPEERRASIR